jgi:hypothetical protein
LRLTVGPQLAANTGETVVTTKPHAESKFFFRYPGNRAGGITIDPGACRSLNCQQGVV